MELRPWNERTFPEGSPPELFPGVVERVRGTPARLEDRVDGLGDDVLTTCYGGRWSIQQHVGHLWDLEHIWAGRLDDVLTGLDELRPRDVENRVTESAGHNTRMISELLRVFRKARMETVKRLEKVPKRALGYRIHHPSLRRRINLVDVFLRVAEHDDHHIARISQIVQRTVVPPRRGRSR